MVFVSPRFSVARTVVVGVNLQVFHAAERTIAGLTREDFFRVNSSRRRWKGALDLSSKSLIMLPSGLDSRDHAGTSTLDTRRGFAPWEEDRYVKLCWFYLFVHADLREGFDTPPVRERTCEERRLQLGPSKIERTESPS